MTQIRFCPIKNIPCERFYEFSTFPNKVFISFDNKIDNVFLEKIENIIKSKGLEPTCFKNEEKRTIQFYCEFICKEIQDSLFVIADLSYWPSNEYSKVESYVKYATNPNVAMEIGLAYAFEKPVILLIKRDQRKLSNLEGVNVCYYDFTPADLDRFYKELNKVIENTIRGALSKRKVEFIYEFERVLKDVVIPFEKLCSKERLLIRNNFDVITKILSKDEEFYEYKEESIKIFEEKMRKGVKYRDIVSLSFLGTHNKEHIERVIGLLKNYPNYEIAITLYKIPFIVEIIDNKIAWLQHWSEYPIKDAPVVQCIVFTLRGTIDEFISQFYSLWNSDKTIKDKEKVIKTLSMSHHSLNMKESSLSLTRTS